MPLVTLQDLSAKLDFTNVACGDNPVTQVVALRSLDNVAGLAAGTVVVLDPDFSLDSRSYRFDLALRSLPVGVAAIIVHTDAWEEPSLTAARLADDRKIALGQLRPDEDVVSLALFAQSLLGTAGYDRIGALDLVTTEVEQCLEIEQIPPLLEACGRHLGTTLRIVDGESSDGESPDVLSLRRAGLVKNYLEAAGKQTPIVKSAIAQVARCIEALYEADYEARSLPEITRSELFNEILLSDASTGADAVNRLRRSEFPVDGSHFAVRIDCHEPLPHPASLQATTRCQARIAEIFVESLRQRPGQWTRAGTGNSILIISTLERAHSDLVGVDAAGTLNSAITQATRQFPGLRLHVGMGTPHLGAAGFRSSVSEAATAVRSARTMGNANQVEQFDRLGLGRALVRWAEIDGVRPVINQILQPILQLPQRQARETLTTLRAYLDAGQNVSKTAEALHLHRNTIRYRIDRIEAMLPVDIRDPDDRLLLELSCRVVDAEML